MFNKVYYLIKNDKNKDFNEFLIVSIIVIRNLRKKVKLWIKTRMLLVVCDFEWGKLILVTLWGKVKIICLLRVFWFQF